MRENWTDERLDDLNEKVDRGFERVDVQFERVSGEIRDLRREMNSRLDSIETRLLQVVLGVCTGMLVGFGALAGLIATQL